jgi:hypothetical protein
MDLSKTSKIRDLAVGKDSLGHSASGDLSGRHERSTTSANKGFPELLELRTDAGFLAAASLGGRPRGIYAV